jgi:GNAT superfamily N-acetyltransferase
MTSFELLCHRPDLAPVVASWMGNEWPDWYGSNGQGNLEEDINAFGASPTSLPIGIVAVSETRPVGFAALKANSIQSHSHLSPWAAAGFVLPGLRGQGIGSQLLQQLVSLASSLGHANVYCGTSTAAHLLERSGWQLQESVLHAGKPLGIYRSGA